MSNQKYHKTHSETGPPSDMPSQAMNFDPTVTFQHRKLNFWQRRSKLEKILGVLVALLLLVIAILAIVLKVQSSKDDRKGETSFCTSKSCIDAASSILNSMDESVNPCEDFYQFSCGKWIKSNLIPDGYSNWDRFSMLLEKNCNDLKRLSETPASQADGVVQNKTKDYYTSCMDPSGILEELEAGPLLELMKDLGGWSISEVNGVTWDEENWNLQEVAEKIHGLGIDVLFGLSVSEDLKEPTKYILTVDQVPTVLEKDHYVNKTIENNKILRAYYKYMVDIGVMLGGETNRTKMLMLEVFEFERALKEISLSQEDRRDVSKIYNKKNITELKQMASFVDWNRFVNRLLVVVNISIDDSEPIIVVSPEFLTKLDGLLGRTLRRRNGKRTVHNYMVWNIVHYYSDLLSKKFRSAKWEFMKALWGTVGEEEQWRSCVMKTDKVLGFVLGVMYVREKFHRESKKSAEIMIRNIKEAFIGNLPNLGWMEEETRLAAVEKANAVMDKIGYPEFILNDTALELKYKELDINKDQFFMNNIRARLHGVKNHFGMLRKVVEKSRWDMPPQTVNAYYSPTKNEIVFPAGILQAPFYDKDLPNSLNYATIGAVMGHELIHGFDDQGREFDKNGVLRLWWNEKSIKAFRNRTKCLLDQYSGYSINGEHLKGKQTLGENIADNGGLKSAYYAYDNLAKKSSSPEPLLPGLNFTHRQLFFIAFAQLWCTVSTPVALSNQIMTDSHSPPNFRVTGSVTNLPEFSEQFNCPVGSTLNPVRKCEVW